MEWVETTGSSVDEAKEAALDELGVDEHDAEFEVLEEAKSGLFGRLRQEARVRARVRPTTPRPKAERRDRRRRAPKEQEAEGAGNGESSPARSDAGGSGNGGNGGGGGRTRGRGRATQEKTKAAVAADSGRAADVDVDVDEDELSLAEQGELVREFLDGLVDAFGLEGSTEVVEVDEETLEARVTGDDLGLLIGPKGQTLQSVQELARTVLMKGPGRGARLRVDVGGYRERRKEALERFTRTIAEQVLESGEATALEPMSPPDRKIVHDTVNTIDGVVTVSEGEDARRRVVIMLDEDAD